LVISARTDASAPFRVIATSGTVVTGGQARKAVSDTLNVVGSAELTAQDPIVTATFVADRPNQRLSITVRENGVETLRGAGELVIVFRTPQGAQLQVTPVPPELRRSP
jgi:hypothetical protein